MTQASLELVIRVLHDRWLPILGLQNWDDESYVSVKEHSDDFANVEAAQWEYERLKVCYFLARMGSMTRKQIEDTVVHELTHAMYQPLRDMMAEMIEELDDDARNIVDKCVNGHEERVTTQVSKALIRAYGYHEWNALDRAS